MKILVTGANGQLGRELRKVLTKHTVCFSDISQEEFTDVFILDIANNNSLREFIENNDITHIINCAAYTQVDQAEKEIENAYTINHTAVKNLSELSHHYKIKLIHISTDFVFSGCKNTPYNEEDLPEPLSVYGKSKLEGEKEIQNVCKNYVIIRTSWLYSIHKNNFVKTIIKYAKERGHLRVVYDQVGTPTYAKDLAEIIVKIIENDSINGIYHYSNEGVISWYDFAMAIVELANIKCTIEPILSNEYQTPAKRPAYSVMDKSKIKRDLGITIPYWRESLIECIGHLING